MTTRRKSTHPLVIGLTGSIGMGKSAVADMLKALGVPVLSADKTVHQALGRGGKAVEQIAALFPAAKRGGAIDRKRLGQEVFGSPGKLRRLEKILHPLTVQAEKEFVRKAKDRGKKAIVLEIPLLFETNAEKRCNVVVCVHAPASVQRDRVLGRAYMTADKFRSIKKQQLPSLEKCRRSDYVIRTDKSLADTKQQVRLVWQVLQILYGL